MANQYRLAASIVTLILVLSIQTRCVAQPNVTLDLLHEATYSAGLGRWTDAIERYQRILEIAGDDLIAVEPPYGPLSYFGGGAVYSVPWSSDIFSPARWICHEHIGRFPAAALKQYRKRVDAAASRRLEQARQEFDDLALEQLLAEFFCSEPAEEAILLLAQRAFDRADFDSAEHYWRMLLPIVGQRSPALYYPNPKTAAASIHARLILAKCMKGEFTEAKHDLSTLRRTYPDAVGLLAGHEGKYVDTLDNLLKEPQSLILPPEKESNKEWTSFGRDFARSRLVTGPMPRYWPGPTTWQSPIPGGKPVRLRGDELPGAPDHPRALAFHPVIAHGRVFVADATRISSYDLLTGTHVPIYDLQKDLPLAGLDRGLPVRGESRYTLTYADGFLYARLGTQALQPTRNDDSVNPGRASASASAVVCIGPLDEINQEKAQARWLLRPPDAGNDGTSIFEGTPVVQGDRLYVVVWKHAGGNVVTSVACYRGLGRNSPPVLVWQRDVGKTAFNPGPDTRQRHDLLTIAGSNVVFATHEGSIIALNARTGKVAWQYRYGRSERRTPSGRDLCPCLYEGGRIFAAPADSDRLLCVDAFSGRLFWDLEGVDVVHLLGVAKGRLIATFAGQVKGIRGINVVSGATAYPDGWALHEGGGEATFGSGFITRDLVYWPTKHGLHFLRIEDGVPARQPIPGLFGNLAYADGCFIVTTATEVWGFVSEGKLLEKRRRELDRQPGDKMLLYLLGLSEIDAGKTDEALELFDRLARTEALSNTANREIAIRAREQAGLIRWRAAERLLEQHLVGQASDLYQSLLAGKDVSAHSTQLLARWRLAQLAQKEGATDQAVTSWQKLLEDERLQPGLLVDDSGHPRLLAEIAAEALRRLQGETTLRAKSVRTVSATPVAPTSARSLELTLPVTALQKQQFLQSNLFPLPDISDPSQNELSAAESIWVQGERSLFEFEHGKKKNFTIPPGTAIDAYIRSGSRIVCCGDKSIFVLNEQTGACEWSWRLACIATESNRSLIVEPSGFVSGRLSGFHRADNRLYALLDSRILLAIDIATGLIVWVQESQARSHSSVTICPFYYAGNDVLMLQLSSGKLRLINSSDGSLRTELASSPMPWTDDPLGIDGGCVLFPEDAGAVTCLDLKTGQRRWRHEIERPTSLIGNLPQIRRLASIGLLGIERNQWMEIEAIDLRTGNRRWNDPFVIERWVSLHSLGCDGNVLYIPHVNGLKAVSLDSGKQLWKVALAGGDRGDWRIVCLKSNLLMFPRWPLPDGAVDFEKESRYLWQRVPTAPRVARFLNKANATVMNRTFPMLILDKSDGHVVQQLQFPAIGLACELRQREAGLTVATGAGVWQIESRAPIKR